MNKNIIISKILSSFKNEEEQELEIRKENPNIFKFLRDEDSDIANNGLVLSKVMDKLNTLKIKWTKPDLNK